MNYLNCNKNEEWNELERGLYEIYAKTQQLNHKF